jgi:periplasmic protein TonB
MTYQEEKDKERKGIITSVIIHALAILLFFFITVWRQPDPPTPGMPGIELNFGFDAVGSGDTNTKDPASEEATEPTEASATTDPVDATTSPIESDHVVPDTKPTTNPTSTTPKPTNTTSPQQTQSTNPNQATTKPSGDGDSQQKGNQGQTSGTIDGKGLYPGDGGKGNGKGGDGALSMAGWHLEAEPKVNNLEKETGKVVFSVKIDDEGNILGINVIEKQVSEVLVQRCKDEINKMEFVKNSNNGSTAPFSTGTITFLFRLN